MIWDTSRPAVTAEWQCTRCATTNRVLVRPGTAETSDKCVHCGTRHLVRPGQTPVRWQAEAA